MTLSTVEPTETVRAKPQFQLFQLQIMLFPGSVSCIPASLFCSPKQANVDCVRTSCCPLFFKLVNCNQLGPKQFCFLRAVYFRLDSYMCVLCGILRATVSSALCGGIQHIICMCTVSSSRILRLMSRQPGQGSLLNTCSN